jgi:hypothetical protein
MTDVSVPQKDGEIVLTTNGERTVLPVTKGKVSAEGVVLDALLANVAGAEVVVAAATKP